MSVRAHTRVPLCTCVCMRVRVCVVMRMSLCVRVCVVRAHVCLCACVYTRVRVCLAVCAHTHVCLCDCVHTCAHTRCVTVAAPAVVTSGTGHRRAPVVKCAVCPHAAVLPSAPFCISRTITCMLNLHSSPCHAAHFLLLSISCNTYSPVPDFKVT